MANDTITVNLSGDVYPAPSGYPIADITVDGVVESPVTVTTLHSSGQTQPAVLTPAAAASHTVMVEFPNDAHQVGGGPTLDRNLYASLPGGGTPTLTGKAVYANGIVEMQATGDSATWTFPGSLADTYPDGSAGAPVAGPNTFINPSFFSGYKARPAWMVAGVDYPVGISGNPTLTDWHNLSMAGVSVNTSASTISVGADNVTFTNIDFSLHGGIVQAYINANNVTFEGCKFGGSNGAKNTSGLLYQANGKGGFKFWNNWVDGGNNPTVAGAEQTFLLAGSGDFSVRYNYFVNYPAQIVQVQNGPCTLDYQFNYIDSGSIAKGAHENWLQASMSGTWTPTVQFNTGIQTRAGLNGWTGGGLIWQFAEGNAPALGCTVNNPVFSYNVMVASPVGTNVGANETAVGYCMCGTTGEGGTTLTGSGVAGDNYVDASGAYGFFYPGSMSAGWTVSGNIDMNTGATITP